MRQETGNNPAHAANKVSIQQSLDGHSFSAAGLSADFPGDAAVEVELLTDRTMLVPPELFDAAAGAAMLAANGMPPLAGQQIVCCEPRAGAVGAFMAVGGEALRQVGERLGGRARFTTPLLHTPGTLNAIVWMLRSAELLYIKVYDRTLRFAEVIPAADDADILYFLERLGGEFALSDFELHIAGDNPKALRKLAGNRFRKVLCE